MSVFYEIDPDVTYAHGVQTTGLSADAEFNRSNIRTTVEGIQPGSQHGAGEVTTGLDNFLVWANEKGRSVANAVNNLGAGTSDTATTAQQTNNESTALFNGQTSLNYETYGGMQRTVNA